MNYHTSTCCRFKAVEDVYQCCFICMKCLDPCEVEELEYDIFLGGPWEKYCSTPYKTIIKKSFSDLRIYDPEDYQVGDWFVNNYLAMQSSKLMFIMVPSFPFPLVAVEAGIYYAMHNNNHSQNRINNLVILWPFDVVPDYTKKHLIRLGQVVETIEDGIKELRRFFKTIRFHISGFFIYKL